MKNIYGRIMKESECPMVLLIERMVYIQYHNEINLLLCFKEIVAYPLSVNFILVQYLQF